MDSTTFGSRLKAARRQVDSIDSAIARLLARRLKTAERIGALKKAAGRPAEDRKRELEVLARAGAIAKAAGVPPAAVARVFSSIIAESKTIEKRLKK